jgi:hypothetical protein
MLWDAFVGLLLVILAAAPQAHAQCAPSCASGDICCYSGNAVRSLINDAAAAISMLLLPPRTPRHLRAYHQVASPVTLKCHSILCSAVCIALLLAAERLLRGLVGT